MVRPVNNSLFSPRPFLFWSLLLPATAFCQTNLLDTAFLLSSVHHAKEIYSNSLRGQSHLYNGVQYKEYNVSLDDKGIPYFESDDWVEGSVDYDGEIHDRVSILYDVVNDKVVIEHGVRGLKLQLIDEKLKYFTLPGHRFVHLVRDTLKNSPMQSGYYDLLSNGLVKFYVKWHKERLEKIEDQQKRWIFADNNNFYIWKKGIYFQVKTKSAVLKVLSDNKTLRKFIRENKISFRQNRVQAIASVVSFYNKSGN